MHIRGVIIPVSHRHHAPVVDVHEDIYAAILHLHLIEPKLDAAVQERAGKRPGPHLAVSGTAVPQEVALKRRNETNRELIYMLTVEFPIC